MATKGNEENIEEIKNTMKDNGLKTIDITSGSEPHTEEDIDHVALFMCEIMDFYPKLCEEVKSLISPFIKTIGAGRKCLMYMEDAFLECEKKLPAYLDKNNSSYEMLVKGKLTLQQENIMYTYIANTWMPSLILRCFVDILGNNGIEPVFRCHQVEIVKDEKATQMNKDAKSKQSSNSDVCSKGVVS